MEMHPEIGTSHFLDLMENYLAERITVETYRSRFFELMKQRTNFTDDEFQIVQAAYGDADDYDAAVRLERTIEEPELRTRIRKSVHDLKNLNPRP